MILLFNIFIVVWYECIRDYFNVHGTIDVNEKMVINLENGCIIQETKFTYRHFIIKLRSPKWNTSAALSIRSEIP